MKTIKLVSLPTTVAESLWKGGVDAYGMLPEKHLSDGSGVPCRHCQQDVASGDAYLILAHSPFSKPQPFMETGPIFLHAEPCNRYPETDEIPAMILKREQYLLKGYRTDDRIAYGTGKIVKSGELKAEAAEILSQEGVAYVHVRSASYNCFTCRIDAAD